MSHSKAACASAALTLDRLAARQWARVVDVACSTDASSRHLALRLTELGFVPDQPVCVMMRGPLGGDPLAVRVGQATFALRQHEAALVQVMPQTDAPARVVRSVLEAARG